MTTMKALAGVSLALLVMGCETMPEAQSQAEPEAVIVAPASADTPPQVQPARAVASTKANFSAYDFQWFAPLAATTEDGRPRRVRGMSNEDLKKTLTLLNEGDCGDFKACARIVRGKQKSNSTPRPGGKLSGIGGAGVSTLVAIAENTAIGADAEVTAKGQIQANCLDDNGAPIAQREGYAYDKQRGYMRICVVVRTTTEIAGVKTSTFEYFDVEATGARHEESCVGQYNTRRCTDAGPANVFPAAAKATGLEINEAKTMPVPNVELNYKLYASGARIKVKRYGLIENVAWTGPMAPTPNWSSSNLWSNWNQGPADLKQVLRKIFARNNDACIDMMFVGEPPASLSFDSRVVYCLGRCKQPALLNTL